MQRQLVYRDKIEMRFLVMLIFAILLGPSLIAESYSVAIEKKNIDESAIEVGPSGAVGVSPPKLTKISQENGTRIFMQILVRDPHGNLVGYAEGYPAVMNLNAVISWIEPKSTKSFFIKDDKMYELMKFINPVTYVQSTFLSSYYVKYTVNGTSTLALNLLIDAIPMSPGDTAFIYWTIMRPVG